MKRQLKILASTNKWVLPVNEKESWHAVRNDPRLQHCSDAEINLIFQLVSQYNNSKLSQQECIHAACKGMIKALNTITPDVNQEQRLSVIVQYIRNSIVANF